MPLTVIIDIVVLLLLIGALITGYRRGFVASASSLVGIAAGSVVALLAVPFVGNALGGSPWKTLLVVTSALALVFAGAIAGTAIGRRIRRRMTLGPVKIADRVIGSAGTLVVTALVLSSIATGITALGIPALSQPIASSTVLARIEASTPVEVRSALAQLRSLVDRNGIPQIAGALGADSVATLPDIDTSSGELARAAASVVRITGDAPGCGQTQSGSGVVISPGRVITNAHVVAGVSEPLVQSPQDGAVAATVVYFDPSADIAILAADTLRTAPIAIVDTVAAGSVAVVNGYPFGGPFRTHPAIVSAVGDLSLPDIYGADAASREVYTLTADVQEGESGGPLLSTDGKIVGLIFAKGADVAGIGYAITMADLAPAVALAPGLSAPIRAGSCISE